MPDETHEDVPFSYDTLISALEEPDLENPVVAMFESGLEIACHHNHSEKSKHHKCAISVSSKAGIDLFYHAAAAFAQHPSTYWQLLKSARINKNISPQLIAYVNMLKRLSNL